MNSFSKFCRLRHPENELRASKDTSCFCLDGYNAENMQYQWENRTDKGVAVNEKLDDMPQYNLTGATTRRYFTAYYSGE